VRIEASQRAELWGFVLTAQERRIARELFVIYSIYGMIVGGWHHLSTTVGVDWGSVPQWITAGVAVCAAIIAVTGIAVQYVVAKKRAAIDIFLKTETDKHLLESWDGFWAGLDHMKTMTVDDFCRSKDSIVRNHYFAVRKYLNLHELIAVGIKNGMFDGRTCHNFWSGVLLRCVREARPVIEHVRNRPGQEATYLELLNLYDDWLKIEKAIIKRSNAQPLTRVAGL